MKSTSASSNYGTNSELRTRRASSSDTSSFESYLKFSLSNLGSGKITSAKLRLYGRLDSGSNIPTSAFSSSSSWSETEITWSNRPASGTTALANTTITDTTRRYYEWDVTSFVIAERNAGKPTVSIALKNPQTSSPYTVFNSREASGNRPQLVVTIDSASSAFLTAPGQMPMTATLTKLSDGEQLEGEGKRRPLTETVAWRRRVLG